MNRFFLLLVSGLFVVCVGLVLTSQSAHAATFSSDCSVSEANHHGLAVVTSQQAVNKPKPKPKNKKVEVKTPEESTVAPENQSEIKGFNPQPEPPRPGPEEVIPSSDPVVK